MPPFEAIFKIAPLSLNPDGGSTITNHGHSLKIQSGSKVCKYIMKIHSVNLVWKYSLEIQFGNAVRKHC